MGGARCWTHDGVEGSWTDEAAIAAHVAVAEPDGCWVLGDRDWPRDRRHGAAHGTAISRKGRRLEPRADWLKPRSCASAAHREWEQLPMRYPSRDSLGVATMVAIAASNRSTSWLICPVA